MPNLILVGTPAPPNPDWYDAMLKRAEANARPRCSYCNAFISKEQAKRSRYWTDYGYEYEPECETGKGCARVRPD